MPRHFGISRGSLSFRPDALGPKSALVIGIVERAVPKVARPENRPDQDQRRPFHPMRLDLSDPARRFLATESIAQGSGARFVARTIARHVTTPLSEAILRGRLASGNTARVDYDGSAITVEAAA